MHVLQHRSTLLRLLNREYLIFVIFLLVHK